MHLSTKITEKQMGKALQTSTQGPQLMCTFHIEMTALEKHVSVCMWHDRTGEEASASGSETAVFNSI